VSVCSFRYDYLSDQPASDLPGFTKFIQNGVKAEFVNPLYPSISYPTWTTLSTGLYAENHNIIGNYFYDPQDKTKFSLFDAETTGKRKWWNSEPLWISATKAGLKAALYLWSRCDVPYDNFLPDTCQKFTKIPGADIFRTNIDKALDKFEKGYDLVQVCMLCRYGRMVYWNGCYSYVNFNFLKILFEVDHLITSGIH